MRRKSYKRGMRSFRRKRRIAKKASRRINRFASARGGIRV